jgi:hypothetical protein
VRIEYEMRQERLEVETRLQGIRVVVVYESDAIDYDDYARALAILRAAALSRGIFDTRDSPSYETVHVHIRKSQPSRYDVHSDGRFQDLQVSHECRWVFCRYRVKPTSPLPL